MLALKYLLTVSRSGVFCGAAALVIYDMYVAEQLRRIIRRKAKRRARAWRLRNYRAL